MLVRKAGKRVRGVLGKLVHKIDTGYGIGVGILSPWNYEQLCVSQWLNKNKSFAFVEDKKIEIFKSIACLKRIELICY